MKGFFKKYKKLLFIFAILVVSLGGGYYYYQSRFTFYVPELVIKDYELIGDDDAVVIDWRVRGKENELVSNTRSDLGELGGQTNLSFDTTLVIGHYASTQQIKLTETPNVDTFNRNEAKLGEYWKISVFDLLSSNLDSTTYDLFELVRSYDSDYAPVLTQYFTSGFIYKGGYYQKLVLRSLTSSEVRQVVLLNLENGEITKMPKEFEVNRNPFFIYYTSLKNHFVNYLKVNSSDTSQTLTEEGKEESKKWQISTQYPEALKLMQHQNARLYFWKQNYDLESLIATWDLLLPEDIEFFNELTIDGQFTVDGKEHTVNSYEEFKKYYRTGE